MAVTEISKTKVFGGWQKFFSHDSKECKCKMKFGVYLPPQAESQKVPVLYFLAGLIANEENFVIKAGAQRLAAKHGVAVVTPDTSPRGCNIEGEEDSWEFGTSAGFYVDATEDKWKNNYRMYSYVTKELPALVNAEFPVLPDRQSITGHSMGGHGAMVCFLKNPGQYRSASAFAPIGLPIKSAWGIRCFSGYLGETNKEAWKEYDSGCLVKKYKGPLVPILVDQGTRDPWLPKDLIHPNELAAAFAEAKVPLNLRWHEDYDHSYFFLATFLEDHFDHHVKYLKE